MFRNGCLTSHGFFVISGIALVLLFPVLAFLTMTLPLHDAPPLPTPVPPRWGSNAEGWPVAQDAVESLVFECARASGVNPRGMLTSQQLHDTTTCIDIIRGALAHTK